MIWQNLSGITGYPSTAEAGVPCGVSIEAAGNDAYVKTLTTTGRVYQLHVAVNGPNFTPDTTTGWVLQVGPALRRGKSVPFHGEVSYGFSPNKVE
ncbi:hypothetical protein ACGFYF_27610 [Streptomyces lavendulae]|uniref:hypothetical protein n=1 Tax=Streptomyces lavendulae TaxID=1914 RepID=UPI003710326E